MVLTFLLFGVTQTPDGVFRRPHPGKNLPTLKSIELFKINSNLFSPETVRYMFK